MIADANRTKSARIIYLTTGCFDKGGISRYCRYQITALRNVYGAANVRVLSLLGPGALGFETPFTVDWHGRGRATTIGRVRFVIAAMSLVISFRPHVIHTAHVHFAPMVYWLAKLCRANTIVNVYGLEVWSSLSRLRQFGLRSMDLVLADCHFTANYIRSAGLHAVAPSVVWDCVDLKRFHPGPGSDAVARKYGIPSKDQVFVVLTLGRLAAGAAHKGYDRLIRAFRVFSKLEENAVLVIAGQGDGRPQLEELSTRLGMDGRVKFIGAVDEADLPDVYRLASVFSLVSDRGHGRGEGLPLTPLEAMACGIPIIVGTQDGSQEAVTETINGFAVDPFDQAAHIAALRIIAGLSREASAYLQDEARRVAEQKFGFENFERKHKIIYDSILRDNRRFHVGVGGH